METYQVRIGKNGRITIPLAVREDLDIRTGDIVILEPQPDKRIVLRKATEEEKLDYLNRRNQKNRKA